MTTNYLLSTTDSQPRRILAGLGTFVLALILLDILYVTGSHHAESVSPEFVIAPALGYGDETGMSIWETLQNRVAAHPFHLISAILFICAIIHTFFANKISRIAHHLADQHIKRERKRKKRFSGRFEMEEDLEKSVHFGAEVLHFFGEIEVIFAIWVLPLMISIAYWWDWGTAMKYVETRNFTEPLFVIVIMALAGTRPIIKFAEHSLARIAALGGGTPGAWWLTVLIIGPVMGSFITEPGAITVSALLLARRFYRLQPSETLKYATIGLLFTSISVGGVLTNFAAPPVLMVAGSWDWDSSFMLNHFGWKAVAGIVISTTLYYFVFRKEFISLKKSSEKLEKEIQKDPAADLPIPLWITLVHLTLLAWTVIHSHHPVIFMGSFLIFLGFYQATAPHQTQFSLRPPLLVGLFLAGLVIHGGLQGWWISPLMSGIGEQVLLVLAVALTAFNDNAAVTYLTTLIPNFSEALKYAVVAGAVTGGGLTVIANAPNPAGQSLLSPYFEDGVSPARLFLAALTPTVIVALLFMFV